MQLPGEFSQCRFIERTGRIVRVAQPPHGPLEHRLGATKVALAQVVHGGCELDEALQSAVFLLYPADFQYLMGGKELTAVPTLGERRDVARHAVGPLAHLKAADRQTLSLARQAALSAAAAAATVASMSSSPCEAVRNINSICEGGSSTPRSSMAW